ncbi:hypothetical protein DPMN_097375 [Dreissena polymorpha]|uniref:Uncharacterized protein n=1 Tax=Dreissena polymorpha TaxID=45954 RepID=A0A9D4LA68_DREPO|nr:hypothetical protein DPMN_097375 [Dreissena polymorpha]
MTDEVRDVRNGQDTWKNKPVEAVINKIDQNYSDVKLYKQNKNGLEKKNEEN